MASPFAIFRRNQQTLLVVLFILAIFAFTMDSLLTDRNINLPMLGLIIGTCVLTAVGVKLKQPAKFAAIGALGGLVIGFGASQFVDPTAPDTVAQSKLGSFSQMEVERMLRDRGVANQFLQIAAQRALDNPQEAMTQARNYSFGITGMGDGEEAVLCYLLLEEAKRLGISIDNTSVSEFISRVTNDKLSKTAYDEILQSINLTDSQLYLILQEQITIRTVQQQLAPSGFMTPEQYWEMYKKMRVSQKIQSVAVPVETLAETIDAPEDGVLQAYFEAHKQNFPGDPDPESVGFRQPRKIQLAYIEASYLDLEATVEEITEEEIETFYEENKDILYLNRQVPDDPLGGNPFPDDPSGGNPFPDDSSGPDLIDPALPGPDLDLDSLIPNKTPDADGSKPESESPADPEGAGKPEPQDSEKSEKPELPQTPESNKPQDPAPPESQSLLDRVNAPLQTVAFLQEEKEPEQNKTPAEKPADKETSEPAPESEGEAPDSKAIPPAPETDLEAPLKAPKPGDEPEVPKYKPLDAFLRDEIRDMLLRQRTNEKQQELATKVLDRMTDLSNDYFELVKNEAKPEVKNKFIKEAQQELQELAKANGLNYAQTPLLNGRELSLSSEHPIGSASLGMELSNASQETVARYVFNLPADSVYEANAARSLDPDSIYVFWKTADREAHIPKWDEPGIEEQVLEAWRLEQARPKAEARAKELADRLRGAEETWSELLLQETVTGGEDGVLLQPLISDTFTWISTNSTPNPLGIPVEVPELTELSTVEKAGPDFMDTIFNQMQPGEVGVVPNHDKSIYYVVQIRDRRPSTKEEFEVQRELFLKANLFPMSIMQFEFPTPYSILVNSEGGELYRAWLDDLKQKYKVEMVERKETRS